MLWGCFLLAPGQREDLTFCIGDAKECSLHGFGWTVLPTLEEDVMRPWWRLLSLCSVALGACYAIRTARPEGPVTLTVIWHAGNLADLLIETSKEYTSQTGVQIRGVFPPMSQAWTDAIAREFATHGSTFDLVVFDSQEMSEYAAQGHVELLNPRLESSTKLKASDFDEFALRQYAEYPEGSHNLYALPINQDCMGLVYRKDLFDDPKERAAFQMSYKRPLAIPETYDQMLEIAAFFTRPSQNLWGIALYGSEDYDACTTPFNCILWSYGGELWDPRTGRVNGLLNSAGAVNALTVYRKLFDYAPPGARNWYAPEVNQAVEDGRVAMAMNWYYFFGAYLDPAKSKVSSHVGFAPLPGAIGVDGKYRRYVGVGGQGVSISTYSTHRDEAWKFLEWFMSEERQWKWVAGGGKTGRVSILKDPKFLEATPYNDSFLRSMHMTKDYWHLPEYHELLAVYQKYVHTVVVGRMSPTAALDRCAHDHEAILRTAGHPGR
jgi:multiple sugar transport system substrate-binding protein